MCGERPQRSAIGWFARLLVVGVPVVKTDYLDLRIVIGLMCEAVRFMLGSILGTGGPREWGSIGVYSREV